jgi:hypothetical protein
MKYDNTNFISSEPLVAEVKQELKSYFEAGAISEVLIPTIIDQALRKLRVMVLKPEEAVLTFSGYKSELPCDFALLDHALLYDADVEWYAGVNSMRGYWWQNLECTGGCDGGDCVKQENYYETISVPTPGFKLTMKHPKMLRVYHGSKALCTEGCENLSVSSPDVLQIFPNKSITATFETGCVYFRYYSRPMDDDNLPMVPEILEVEEYVKSYLKFKFFEQLWHSVVDESQRQVEAKFQYYRQDQLNKLQAANGFLLTYTKQQMADNVARTRTRFNKFYIS